MALNLLARHHMVEGLAGVLPGLDFLVRNRLSRQVLGLAGIVGERIPPFRVPSHIPSRTDPERERVICFPGCSALFHDHDELWATLTLLEQAAGVSVEGRSRA